MIKKQIMLAILIVIGLVANAASVRWTAANIYGSDGTTKWSGLVSLYAYESTGTIEDAFLAATFTPTSAGVVSYTFSSDELVAGNTYNLYFTIEDGNKLFTSSEKTGIAMQPTATSTVGFGNMATETQNASNWVAVPEPTSGLLLLLGMAGLALRRKRA